MSKGHLFVSLSMIVGLLEGCSGLRIPRHMRSHESDWTTLGGGPSRTNEASTTLVPPLVPLWEYNAQAGLSAAPLVRDSIMIVTTLHGEVQAVNLSNGKRIGYVILESAIAGTPVLDGGFLVVPLAAKTESLVCYDLREGKRAWVFSAGPIESSPLLLEGSVYVTTLDGNLICINRASGMEQWRFKTSDEETQKPIRSTPATDGVNIFFGSDEGTIYAINRSSGQLAWKYRGRAGIFAGPAIVGPGVVVGDLAGVVMCLDSKTGALRWTYKTGSKIYAPAAADAATVYASSADGNLHALEAETGKRKWFFSARSVLGSSPLVAGEFLYVGSLDRMLYALKSATGEEVWRYEAEGRIRVSPVLCGTILLLTSEDKYITALKPRSP